MVVLEPGGGVRADGTPDEVFAAHGDSLADAGVWVPGRSVRARPAATAAGEGLLTADRLGLPPRLAPTDLTVRSGEAVAVLGRNGVGKTTLALQLGGLMKPGTGRLTATAALAGADAATPPHRWRATALVRRIGSVFQSPEHQFLTGTVFDELALGPRRTGHPEAAVRSTVDELLTRLRLDRLARANPYTLSGGEARRLSVATALATAPRLLVLDEPTFGQDRRTWIELVDLLADLRDAGHGVVTVTHDADFVAAIADRTVTLAGATDPAAGPVRRGADGVHRKGSA